MPTDVTEAQLESDPLRWHGQTIRVVGTWVYELEHSHFARVWFSPPAEWNTRSIWEAKGTYRVCAVGTWLFPHDGTRFGHMGQWPGTFRVSRFESLERLPEPTCDALTGALFRRVLVGVAPIPHPRIVAVVDVDGMQAANVRHGHWLGDELLRGFAQAIREAAALGEGEHLCRWSGDGFALVLHPTAVTERLEAVRRAVRAVSHPSETASIGWTEARVDESVTDAVTRAQHLASEALRAGGDRVLGEPR